MKQKTFIDLSKYKVGDYVHLYVNSGVRDNIMMVYNMTMEEYNKWRITDRRARILEYGRYGIRCKVEIILKNRIISFFIDKDDIEEFLTTWQVEDFEFDLSVIRYNL